MPKFSARSAKALAFLKRAVNDVEIFVEDTANRNMWVRLLTPLLPNGTRLRSINMLGGRRAVVDACAADQADDGRRKLFIIDGDFDALHGRPKPRLKFLYRLRAYCVENILISENAVTNIMLETDPMISETAARAKFAFRDLERMISEKLRPLFEAYAVVNRIKPSIPTVSYPITNCCVRDASGELRVADQLVARRIRDLWRALLRHFTKSEIKRELNAVRARSSAVAGIRSVSGKHYIFPLVENRMRLRAGVKGTSEQLKVRLAGHFDSRSEPYLARRLAAL